MGEKWRRKLVYPALSGYILGRSVLKLFVVPSAALDINDKYMPL